MDPNFDADVVFLVDSAWSVGRPNFQTEKDFVKSFARSLNVQPGKSRGSVISYSTNPQVHFRFDDYKTTKDFDKLVDSTPFLGQYRRMDKAIQEAEKVLNAARPNVPRVVVLLTAGRDSAGAQELEQAVKPLQAQGAKVFIVAIGNDPDIPALTRAVEKNDDLFKVTGFSQLPDNLVPTANHVVKRAGKKICRPRT